MQTDTARLLVVEDDDQLAELLLEYLGMHGFELTRVAAGDVGIEKIREMQPDLVILDASAPGSDPVARIHLPQRVPFGFHGSWIDDSVLPA